MDADSSSRVPHAPGIMAGRRRILLWVVLVSGLCALVVFGLASGGSEAVGRLAPALPREQLAGPSGAAGGSVTADGHARLVTFWASWCGPCAHEAPALQRFSASPTGHARLTGVDWSDGLSQARTFIRRYSWTFLNLRDSEGAVGSAYHLTGLPTTFAIDASGRIRAVLRGPQDEASLGRALAGAQ